METKIVIRTTKELKAALEKLAAEDQRSLNSYLVLWLKKHIEQKEVKK